VTESSEIAKAFTPYYRSLYAKKTVIAADTDTCRTALRNGNQTLPPTAEACAAPITTKEMLTVTLEIPTGKSPGPDRIPNALYKIFAKALAPLLTAVYNQAHDIGHLPAGMSEGLIAILYKKKIRTDPRNYRPITLLNSDYKILMRILTNRFAIAVKQFVSATQNGFVPDSFICENIMLLQLLQAFALETDMEWKPFSSS
jgi:hypothetical protein